MSHIQSPQVPKTPANKEFPQVSKKVKEIYCILCRRIYLKYNAQDHMHSMLHHRELETVLGKDAFHDCQACKVKSLGLKEFAKHVSTTQHKEKLKKLKTECITPKSLFKSLSKETIHRIMTRNKALKKEEKKTMKKKRKKQKQEAGQKHGAMQPSVARKKTSGSQGGTKGNSTHLQPRMSKQQQQAHYNGSNGVVFQNKENKMSGLQSPIDCRGAPFHKASWRPNYPRGMLRGQPRHHYFQNQFAPFFVNNQLRFGNFQNYRFPNSQDNCQIGSFNVPAPDAFTAVNQANYYNTEYNYATQSNFASDQFSGKEPLLFEFNQSANTGSSQPEGSGCSTQPASANSPASPAPIRDVDVNFMLKQIRKELGVREPCRADREARKQNSEASVGSADGNSVQQTDAEQPADATIPTPTTVAPQAGTSAAPSSVAPGKSKRASLKEKQETSQLFKKDSTAEEEHGNSKGGDSLVAKVTSKSPKVAAFGPNLSLARKVRIAHKAAQGENSAACKQVLDKLLSLSETKTKLSWREMYNEKKGKTLKDKSRFRTELVNRPDDKESAALVGDLPLSEGFHWEPLSESPSVQPPPSSDADTTETQTVPRVQDPDAAQVPCSTGSVKKVSIKAEPNVEGETEDLREENGSSKRKRLKLTGDGGSDGKKKKTKSNRDQSQMDELLAVSLKEDELSRSLQELDKSLIQARNALQAAYAEVQRLLLLRQQFSAEVNGLRAKRIEILQGMQEGYSKGSDAASSSIAAPSSFTLSSFPSSSSPHPPAAAPASSITHSPPAPLTTPAVSIKQEVSCRFATTEPAVCPNAASSSADGPHVPLNKPAPSFPAYVLPLTLLQPSLSSASTSFAQQPTAESSTSAKSPAPESSARKQQETGVGLKSCGKTTKSQPPESESVGNVNQGGVKGAIKIEKKPSDENDDGSESDSSVEMIDSNLEVIAIDESDVENSAEADPAEQPEEPLTSVGMELSSASTQTCQQNEPDSKFQPPVLSRNDASAPPSS
ncbi:actin cytoskeleton-regulatory complex protein pan1 [Nematolebias whitei]|uniref:actin cytoskeleton-regulatory complex protein pan1 n=1 Tax=Nematolebias whitei TaxID=451745 RepID=UPI00189778FC|nr:actin cytoskeleton-regulatory complex protein pan1 [Nematolebias whitei]